MFGKSIIAATVAAAAFALSAQVSQAQNLKTVRYHEFPGSMSHLVNWVMREKGFCAKEGLKCEPVSLASGPLAAQAAAAGSVDIILSSVDQLFLAIANGNDLQLISSQQTDHNWTFSARKGFFRPNSALGYPAHRKFKRSPEAPLGAGLAADTGLTGLELTPEPLPCADSNDSARLGTSDRAWQALIPRLTPSHPASNQHAAQHPLQLPPGCAAGVVMCALSEVAGARPAPNGFSFSRAPPRAPGPWAGAAGPGPGASGSSRSPAAPG